jgi:hypothetical protein
MKIIVLIDQETVFTEDPSFTGDHKPVRDTVEFHIIRAIRGSTTRQSFNLLVPIPWRRCAPCWNTNQTSCSI